MAKNPPAEVIRDAVEQAGGHLVIAVTTLLAVFGARHLDSATAAHITDDFARVGLDITPELQRVGAADDVALSLDTWRGPRGGARDSAGNTSPGGPAAAPPAGAVDTPAAVVAHEAAALSSAAITAGVLGPGVIATAIGFATWWGYGLLFLATSTLLWFALGRARYWFARIFLWPLGAGHLSAVLLGLVPTLTALVVVGVLVASPLAAARAANAADARDARLVHSANRSLDRQDLGAAQRELSRVDKDWRQHSAYRQVAARVADLSAAQRRDRQHHADYVRAQQEFDGGEFSAAVELLESLDSYQGAPELARRYRNEGARRLRADASAALREKQWSRAIDLAQRSSSLHPTRQARRLRDAGRRGDAAARARARAQRRARLAAAHRRAQRRAIARRRRAAQRRERRHQAQLDREVPTPSIGSTGSDGGGSGAIICNDGYVWPGTTRQGACHGHDGIVG
jgi:hypothetical protein